MRSVIIISFLSIWIACKNGPDQIPASSFNDRIRISADEAFRPVMDEQIAVYKALHPDARIIIDYKPEAACWKDLYDDSTKMVIVSRRLQTKEAAYFYDSLRIYPQNHLLALDAIALIINRSVTDSLFSLRDIEEILSGNERSRFFPVFDGIKATGTVRFALDSILKGKTAALSKFRAARSSREVVNYVANNPDAIGFIGVSWIGNPDDPEQRSLLKKVRIAWLPCRGCSDSSYTYPSQEEIHYRRYPFTRTIYAVVKEKAPGPANDFVQFMKTDQGQLLFRRMYLVPAIRPFIVRETVLTADSL